LHSNDWQREDSLERRRQKPTQGQADKEAAEGISQVARRPTEAPRMGQIETMAMLAHGMEDEMKRIASFVWLMCRIAWECFRHPFTTTRVEWDDK